MPKRIYLHKQTYEKKSTKHYIKHYFILYIYKTSLYLIYKSFFVCISIICMWFYVITNIYVIFLYLSLKLFLFKLKKIFLDKFFSNKFLFGNYETLFKFLNDTILFPRFFSISFFIIINIYDIILIKIVIRFVIYNIGPF